MTKKIRFLEWPSPLKKKRRWSGKWSSKMAGVCFLSPIIMFMFCVFLRLHCLPNACILPTSTSSCYSSEIQVSKFGFHGYYASNLSSKGAAIFGSRKQFFLSCLLLTLSGDVHFNPGPSTPRWKFPCCFCAKPVKRNHKGLCCDFCNCWLHTSCCAVDDHNYDNLSISSCSWICFDCGLPNFSDSFFDSSVDSFADGNISDFNRAPIAHR